MSVNERDERRSQLAHEDAMPPIKLICEANDEGEVTIFVDDEQRMMTEWITSDTHVELGAGSR
jgi:hypothetical protein